jgi:hypothetical protein
MLEKVLGVGVVRRWLYLAAKTPQVGVDADELSYPCTVLMPVDVGLERRALGSRLFSLT